MLNTCMYACLYVLVFVRKFIWSSDIEAASVNCNIFQLQI